MNPAHQTQSSQRQQLDPLSGRVHDSAKQSVSQSGSRAGGEARQEAAEKSINKTVRKTRVEMLSSLVPRRFLGGTTLHLCSLMFPSASTFTPAHCRTFCLCIVPIAAQSSEGQMIEWQTGGGG